MRLVSYFASGGYRSGIETDDGVVDVCAAAGTLGWTPATGEGLASVRRVVGLSQARMNELERAADEIEPVRDVIIGPPVPDPQKIICLGLNYRDHAKEAGLTPPAAPMFFAKYPNSLIGPTDDIVPPAVAAAQVDYEAELAVVIGTRARSVASADALEHVAGAMAFNDVSARDLQLANNLWTGGKAIDTFGPCGPALVVGGELGNLQSLYVRARVNDELVQDGTTASMIFGVAETIAFLSQIMTLEPGDIIATGTPAGVGNSREPKLFLHPGDVVEVEIEGIGTLRNRVAQPA